MVDFVAGIAVGLLAGLVWHWWLLARTLAYIREQLGGPIPGLDDD
jgi:hypothetical protein